MTRSELVFFDSAHNSRLGTARAAISFFPMLVIFSLLVVATNKKVTWRTVIGVILLSTWLCSAIGVQLPKTYKQAALYGFLVGSVAGACVTAVALITLTDPPKTILWSIVVLPLITCPLAILTLWVSNRLNLYS